MWMSGQLQQGVYTATWPIAWLTWYDYVQYFQMKLGVAEPFELNILSAHDTLFFVVQFIISKYDTNTCP